MDRRLWGLTRRQTVVAIGLAVLVGFAIALVTGGNGSSDRPAPTAGIERIDTGTTGSRDAVWVFGFQTLRFGPGLRSARQLDVQGFGSVVGAPGRVYMYDAGTGRVGVLDSRRNTLRTLGRLPRGTAQDDTFAPGLAPLGTDLWLVSAPGALTRFDRDERRADEPIAVGTSGGSPPTATGVVATTDGVFAATRDDGGITVARIDATRGAVVATLRIDVAGDFDLDGFAVDAGRLWMLAAGEVFEVDPTTMALAQRRAVANQEPGATKGLVAAGGQLWTLVDRGGALGWLDRSTGRVHHALRILPRPPQAFRTPASLVTDGSTLWAMVQQGDGPDDHAARLVGYHPRSGTPTRGVDLPSALFAGAAAAT